MVDVAKGSSVKPGYLKQYVKKIEQWWLPQRARRKRVIEQSLVKGGMTVWPGLMGLLKEY